MAPSSRNRCTVNAASAVVRGEQKATGAVGDQVGRGADLRIHRVDERELAGGRIEAQTGQRGRLDVGRQEHGPGWVKVESTDGPWASPVERSCSAPEARSRSVEPDLLVTGKGYKNDAAGCHSTQSPSSYYLDPDVLATTWRGWVRGLRRRPVSSWRSPVCGKPPSYSVWPRWDASTDMPHWARPLLSGRGQGDDPRGSVLT